MASMDGLIQHLMKNRQTIQTAEIGKEPKFTTPVHELRSQHKRHAVTTHFINEVVRKLNRKISMFSTNTAYNKPPSKTSLKNLKRISLKDLRILVVAEGSYVILRTLEPAYKDNNIITVVEDDQGNAGFFYASNITEDPDPNLDEVLPVGTIFILKEPCIHHTSLGDCMVSCNSPSDMTVLYEGHDMFQLAENIIWKNEIDPKLVYDPVSKEPKPKTTLEWKERGNELFKDGKFEFAKRCYLLALKDLQGLDDEKNLKTSLWLNLAASYLKMEFFENALEFASNVLADDPENIKALFRAGKASYLLRKYEDAREYFEKCLSFCPENEVVEKELQRSKDRCLEQKTGVFDMYEMILRTKHNDRCIFDCADYVGPIKIVKIPGKGRGIVATRDIEPGTLLVVSKALSFTWLNLNKPLEEISKDEIYNAGYYQKLIAHLVQLIAKNPNTFGPIVYDLFNMFIPVEEGQTNLFCDPETKKEPIIDVQRIEEIFETNSYEQNFKFIGLKTNPVLGTGLFVLPSYFNHSCLPNTANHGINNVTFINAIQYIKAGEEVVMAYQPWLETVSERQSVCKSFGFQCSCRLCKQDGKLDESVLFKRVAIMSRWKRISSRVTEVCLTSITDNLRTYPDMISDVKKLISEMNATYSNNSGQVPSKIAMAPLYELLCAVYGLASRNGPWKMEKQIECCHNILGIFGFDPQVMLRALENGSNLISPKAYLDKFVLNTIALLIYIYHRVNQNETENKWLQILCTLHCIHKGGCVDGVKYAQADLEGNIFQF